MQTEGEASIGTDDVPAAPALQRSESASGTGKSLVSALFLFAAFTAAGLSSIRSVRAGNEPDLWWHIATGDWILQHRTTPLVDVFSSATMGKPWIAYTWLFDLLTAAVFGSWGLQGIVAVTGLLTLAITAVLTALFSRYTAVPRALALAVIANLAMLPLSTPRPWLFSILFFTVELWLLLEACERGRPARLLPVVPLMAIWANLHVQFIYGLGLLGLFAVLQSTLGTTWPIASRWLWRALAAASLATLSNPYGIRLYTVVLHYATEKAPFKVIQEMQPLSFRDISSWITLFLVCAACYALGQSRRHSALHLSLFPVACIFGFRAGRDLWFPVIVSGLILANWFGPRNATGRAQMRGWTFALPASVLLVVWISFHGIGESGLQRNVSSHFPVAAAAWVRSHSLPGPLYNPYDWGGYLIWSLPEHPVSIDGRANLHGDARLERSIATLRGSENWAQDPELANAATIIVERSSPLASILRSSAGFSLVYQDKIAAVFQPRVMHASYWN